MSLLCRAGIGGATDFDPYGDDEPKPAAQKPKPKRPRGPRPPGAKGPAPRPQRPPQLKPDVDGFSAVDAEYDMEYCETEGLRTELVKVEGALDLPVPKALEAECTVYSKIPQKFERKLQLKAHDSKKDVEEIPVVWFMDFGEAQQFSAQRSNLNDEYVVASVDDTSAMSLRVVNEWYNLRPYLDDAAAMLDGDTIDRMMRYGRQQVNLSAALANITLTPQDVKAFAQMCKAAHYDTLNRERFEEMWSQTKTRDCGVDEEVQTVSPPPALVKRIFGVQTHCELSMERVLLELRSVELGREVTQDEEDARQYRAQQRDQDEEQDNVEEVDGVEKVFDDDREEELDGDQNVAMDADIRQWHRAEVDAELTRAYHEWKPEKKDDDDEEAAADAEAGDDAAAAAATDAGRKRPLADAPPSPPPPAKRARTAADPSKAKLHSEIDVKLRTLFPKGASGAPPPPLGIDVVESKVMKALTEYKHVRAEGKKREKAGSVGDAAQYMSQYVTRWQAAVRERIEVLGGAVTAAGQVTWSA